MTIFENDLLNITPTQKHRAKPLNANCLAVGMAQTQAQIHSRKRSQGRQFLSGLAWITTLLIILSLIFVIVALGETALLQLAARL